MSAQEKPCATKHPPNDSTKLLHRSVESAVESGLFQTHRAIRTDNACQRGLWGRLPYSRRFSTARVMSFVAERNHLLVQLIVGAMDGGLETVDLRSDPQVRRRDALGEPRVVLAAHARERHFDDVRRPEHLARDVQHARHRRLVVAQHRRQLGPLEVVVDAQAGLQSLEDPAHRGLDLLGDRGFQRAHRGVRSPPTTR